MRFDEIDSMTQDDVTVSLRRDVWRRMWDVFVYLLCLFTLSLVYWTLIMSISSSFLVCGLACVRRYMRLYIYYVYLCLCVLLSSNVLTLTSSWQVLPVSFGVCHVHISFLEVA